MHHAGQGRAQITHALTARTHQHEVLVGVQFLFAAVMQRLFLALFRALPPPLHAIHNQIRWFGLTALMPRYLHTLALG